VTESIETWFQREILCHEAALVRFLARWLPERADVQDEVLARVAALEAGSVKIERWGPRWLNLLGADRYRRTVCR
jgi:hypothetical protein